MKISETQRPYVRTLLDENQQLGRALTELRSRVASVEEESRQFAARYVEVEQQNNHLANLYVASYQLHGTFDRERVLVAIKEVIVNLIGSEELAIWEASPSGHALELIDSFGLDAAQWRSIPLDAQAGIIGLVAVSGQRFIAGESEITTTGEQRHLSACIPLRLDDQLIGVIGIFRLLPQKSGFEPIDIELFDLLASQAATALFCTRVSAQRAMLS